MDLKTLTTFISVAELSSFTKAALTLGYSQSTVSFQIRQLEAELNAQLFERINHTVVLTERGKEVLRYAYQMQQLTAELTETMASQSSLHGHIRLAMADSLRDSLLDQQFPAFWDKHPKLSPGSPTLSLNLLLTCEAQNVSTWGKHETRVACGGYLYLASAGR